MADKLKAETQNLSARHPGAEDEERPGYQEPTSAQAQQAEAFITAKSSKERIEIVDDQIESMNIRSPQDGIITTWEAKET